jgi:hypothetical protein
MCWKETLLADDAMIQTYSGHASRRTNLASFLKRTIGQQSVFCIQTKTWVDAG